LYSFLSFYILLPLQEPGTPLSMQHYRGIYMLQEKVDRDKDRVNIAKFDANSDMSGKWHHQLGQHKRLAALPIVLQRHACITGSCQVESTCGLVVPSGLKHAANPQVRRV
jgi:hypothetical protein